MGDRARCDEATQAAEVAAEHLQSAAVDLRVREEPAARAVAGGAALALVLLLAALLVLRRPW